MELILNTNLETAIPAVIDWNHEALKTELSERLAHYNNLVVTEDAIKDAKADRAKLNKLRTAFDDKRKEVKKACLKPYEDFEKKAKEIIALIDQPIAAIDTQTKAFDEIQRTEKLGTLTAFYTANIGELREVLPLEKVLPAKWENKGETIISITQQMLATIQRVKNEIGIIKAMKLDFEQNVLDVYLRTLDMSAALAEKTRMEEQAERLKKLAEAQKPTEPAPLVATCEGGGIEEVAGQAADNVRAFMDEKLSEPQRDIKEHHPEWKTIKVVFYDTTAAFRAEMKALTDRHGIRYGGIK